jgi:hypothetical protein
VWWRKVVPAMIPLRLISIDNKNGIRGWLTDSMTYLAEFFRDDTYYIVHGKCIDIDDDREYFEPIEINKSDIKLQVGRNIVNLDIAIVLSIAIMGVSLEAS